MIDKKALIFDFGASSGRAMLASCVNGRIKLEEVHRFPNDPVLINGTLYWDVLRLFHEIKCGIVKAKNQGSFHCIGIDTWGADFGLVNKNGDLVEAPVHCRDKRTNGIPQEVFSVIPPDEIYNRTGIQFNQFNTIYQLYSLVKNRPEVLERTDKLLPMADLFAYLLTGKQSAEYTLATTTQLIDPSTRTWNVSLLEQLGIPVRILPEVIAPGSIIGHLHPDLCTELGTDSVPVYASCAHDTASAVVSVPSQNFDFAYISSGTWSLLGTEIEEPIISDLSRKYNFTNEGGFNGTIRLLTNIMGLWLIQESRRQWQREGKELSFADLEKMALSCPPFKSFINPNDPSFAFPGNLPLCVKKFCKRTNQEVPETIGEVMICIYQSLALTYRFALERLEKTTGRHYSQINIVGGGSKDTLLCQMTANACNRKVVSGPNEATSVGNAVVCLLSEGAIPNLASARKMIAESFPLNEFIPVEKEAWDAAYRTYRKLYENA